MRHLSSSADLSTELSNVTWCSAAVSNSTNYLDILSRVITPVIFGIIVIVGFIGNFLVLVVIIANTQMRNTTNILIFSLALADMAFIIFCVPFTAIIYASGGWPVGSVMCKVYQYTIYVSAYASVYTLVLMSLDRYLAVVHPLVSKPWRTRRNSQILVASVWAIFLLVHIPLIVYSDVIVAPPVVGLTCVSSFCFYTKLVIYDDKTGRPTSHVNYEQGRIFYTLFFAFGFLLPLVIIIFLYAFLINILLCGRTAKIAHSNEAMRAKRRVTRMVIIVIIVFAGCWLPIQSIFLVQFYGTDMHGNLFRTVHVISNCLAYGNSCVNPILYAFFSDNFRRAFARVLCFKRLQPQEIDRFEMQTENGRTSKPLISSHITQAAISQAPPRKERQINVD